MNINRMVRDMKKSLCLLLTVALMTVYIPRASAVAGAFEDIQILKGDVYTIPAKGLQRVSVTDPNVADITDAKPEQVNVVGQTPGQTVVFLWDESGKRSFIVRVLAEDLGRIRSRIREILAKSGVTGVGVEQNDAEGKVMLTGTVPEDKMSSVTSVVDSFPGSVLNLVKKENIEDMIQLDMQITELSTTLTKTLGVDWTNSLTYSEKLPDATYKSKDLFRIGGFARTPALVATVNALITEGKGHILSKPRLVVKNGKEATFLVGGEVPIKTTTTAASSSTTQTSTTFKSYGISMGATPTIKDGKVDLLLNLEISDIDAANSDIKTGDVAFITRTAQTSLYLEDKQTIVLAGMIKKRNSSSTSRIPFVSKIPIIGALFRNSTVPDGNGETEVVISITPTIIKVNKSVEVPEVASDMPPALISRPVIAEVKLDEQIQMAAGRNDVKLPVIAKNASDVPVTISSDLKPYAEEVQQKVSSSIAYPYEAQENRWQGTVKLALVIRKDGSLRDVFVKESSGYDVFDQDAVNTAQILAPYSPFPANIKKDEITVTLPIVYSLDAFLKNVAKRK